MKYEELITRSKFALRIKDYDQAIKFISSAIDINNESPNAYLLLGTVYQSKGDYTNAIDNYEIAISKNSKLIEAYNNLGVIYKNLKHYDKSVYYFKEALKIDHKRADIYYNLGNVHKIIDKLRESINDFERAIKLNPEFTPSYNNLGIIYEQLGKYNEAINVYQKGLKVDYNNLKLHYNLGVVFELMNNLDEAEEHYKKAVELNPNCIDAHNNLGVVYEKLGQIENAKNCYEDALSLNPNYIKSRNNLALVYEKINDYENAIKEYKKAIAVNPNYTVALSNLGKLLYLKESYNEAEAIFEKLLKINKDDFDSSLYLARVLEKIDPNRAVDVYNNLLRNDPTNGELRKSLGDLYMSLDRNFEALEEYKKVEKLLPGDIENKVKIAQVSKMEGEYVDAIKTLEELAASGSDDKVMNELGSIYLEIGENDKAINIFEKLKDGGGKDELLSLNLAKAYKANKNYDKAMENFQTLLDIEGTESVGEDDIEKFNERLNLYEETVKDIALKNEAESKRIRDKLREYDISSLMEDDDVKNKDELNKNEDGISNIEESLQNSFDAPIINIGDDEPYYSIEEEEEFISAKDKEEEPEEDEEKFEPNSMLNLLQDQDTYDELPYRREEDKEKETVIKREKPAFDNLAETKNLLDQIYQIPQNQNIPEKSDFSNNIEAQMKNLNDKVASLFDKMDSPKSAPPLQTNEADERRFMDNLSDKLSSFIDKLGDKISEVKKQNEEQTASEINPFKNETEPEITEESEDYEREDVGDDPLKNEISQDDEDLLNDIDEGLEEFDEEEAGELADDLIDEDIKDVLDNIEDMDGENLDDAILDDFDDIGEEVEEKIGDIEDEEFESFGDLDDFPPDGDILGEPEIIEEPENFDVGELEDKFDIPQYSDNIVEEDDSIVDNDDIGVTEELEELATDGAGDAMEELGKTTDDDNRLDTDTEDLEDLDILEEEEDFDNDKLTDDIFKKDIEDAIKDFDANENAGEPTGNIENFGKDDISGDGRDKSKDSNKSKISDESSESDGFNADLDDFFKDQDFSANKEFQNSAGGKINDILDKDINDVMKSIDEDLSKFNESEELFPELEDELEALSEIDKDLTNENLELLDDGIEDISIEGELEELSKLPDELTDFDGIDELADIEDELDKDSFSDYSESFANDRNTYPKTESGYNKNELYPARDFSGLEDIMEFPPIDDEFVKKIDNFNKTIDKKLDTLLEKNLSQKNVNISTKVIKGVEVDIFE